MYFQTYRLIFSIYAGQNVNVPHSGIPSSCAQDYVFSHCVLCRAAPPIPPTLLSLKWVATIYLLSTLDDLLAAFFPVQLREKVPETLIFLSKKTSTYIKSYILFGKEEEERKKNEQVFPPKMLCTVASKEILHLSKLNIPPPVISPYSTSTSDCTFYFRWTWTSFECRLDHIQILVSSNPTSFKSCTKTSRYVHFISTCTQ